jgi:hypothetical protein
MSEEGGKQFAQIGLSEKNNSNRAGIFEGILADLKEALPGIFVDLSNLGRTWLWGKSSQETAKADQILSETIDRIGRLKLAESEQQHRQAIESAQHDVEIEKKRMELYLNSLERAVKIVKDLSEMGVDIDITAILQGLPFHISSVQTGAMPVQSTSGFKPKDKK